MGFLSRLFHSRDKPTNSTNGSAYRFLFGGSNSGKAVNERSAMQMTAVYACVRILSESIAGLPVHIYKYTDSCSKEKAINHPLYRLIHDEPNPEMTSFVFRETLMTHPLLYGNAYAQIIRNGKGEVIALYPLMANRMSVDRDDKGHLYYQYQMQDSDAPTLKNGTVILKPSDVLHVPDLGFDGLVGYSPSAMTKNATRKPSFLQGFSGDANLAKSPEIRHFSALIYLFLKADRPSPHSLSKETYPRTALSSLYILSPAAPQDLSLNWSVCRKYRPSVAHCSG